MQQEELKIKLRTAMADMSLVDEMEQVKESQGPAIAIPIEFCAFP